MQHDPAPISGHDLFKVLYGSTFKLNRSEIAGEVNALVDKIEADMHLEDAGEETKNSDHRMPNRRSN